MLEPVRRRFTLSDVAILIAAAALGIVQLRYVVDMNLSSLRRPNGSPMARIDQYVLMAIHYAAPVLFTLSLAALAISLLPSRPPLSRLAREPGFVALAIIALSIFYYAIHLVSRVVANYYSGPLLSSSHYLWMLANCLLSTGWDVAVAWFVLALQGNWKHRPIPTEVLGMILGFIYIIISTSYSIYAIFNMMKTNYF